MKYQRKGPKKCEPDCKGRITNAKRGVYCKCISKLLPRGSQQSIEALSLKDTDKPPKQKPASQIKARKILPPSNLHIPESVVVERLRLCGLSEKEIEMIFLKFWDRKKNGEIAEATELSDHRRASEAIKKLLKKLEEAGFNLTDEDCGA